MSVLSRAGLGRASVAAIITLSWATPLEARTLHVSVSGDDDGSGSEGSPLRSIQRAVELAQAGDTVEVGAGTFHERVVIEQRGTTEAPIVIQGARAASGELLTVLDGSEAVTDWVPVSKEEWPSNEAYWSPGVYKTTSIPYEPFCVVSGDKDIAKLSWKPGSKYDMFKYIGLPADEIVNTQYTDIDVPYWDMIGALYAHHQGTTYVRFRQGEDPNLKDVRAAPSGAGFRFEGAQHVTVRNVKVLGHRYGALFMGEETSHNILEHCDISTGQARVEISDGAHHNHVRRNVMYMSMLAKEAAPGAWLSSPEDSLEVGRKEHLYNVYKHEVGAGTLSSDDDRGVSIVDGAGAGNAIYENHIFDTLVGVVLGRSEGTRVYANVIEAASSTGLTVRGGAQDAHIHGNLLIDANSVIRIHALHEPEDRDVYVYDNVVWNPDGRGALVYFHWSKTGSPGVASVWFYHNSMSGGHSCLRYNPYAKEQGGLPEGYAINNVFSCQKKAFRDFFGPFGGVAYSWLGGEAAVDPEESWYKQGNIRAAGERAWDSSVGAERWELPVGHEARGAGRDVSRRFEIGSRSFEALPGMDPGYFQGASPHMGAWQQACREDQVRACVEGALRQGLRTCRASSWSDCEPIERPTTTGGMIPDTSEETCGDAEDNNGDGQIDEGCPAVERPLLEALHVTPPEFIDGARDMLWEQASSISFESAWGERVEARSAWSDQALYLLIEANDDALWALEGEADQVWQDDNVEIFMDLDASGGAWDPERDVHVFVNLTGLVGAEGALSEVVAASAQVGVALDGTLNEGEGDDSGYAIEIAIPWEALGVSGAQGMEMGLDIARADRDGEHSPYRAFDWAELNPFAQPEGWGRLRLLAQTEQSETDPVKPVEEEPPAGGGDPDTDMEPAEDVDPIAAPDQSNSAQDGCASTWPLSPMGPRSLMWLSLLALVGFALCHRPRFQ